MYNAGSGWPMTSLNTNPLIISLVQVATSLAMFLFAMPAGALADMLDSRRFLIFGETVPVELVDVMLRNGWQKV